MNDETAQQKETEWLPSPKQAAVLEAAQEPGNNRSIVAICKEAKVNRKTLYGWWKTDPEFTSAWNSLWELSIDRHMPSVVAAQVKKAQGGDTQAARLLVDLSGKMIRKVDVTSGGEKLQVLAIEVVKPDGAA